ncbi:MAG TPA: SpoIIE family protein phosphatase [Xanthomonadaceae bacterium]|nr:SpoIIE family protein phosphatase [Xanthomonadaceae bacterium]
MAAPARAPRGAYVKGFRTIAARQSLWVVTALVLALLAVGTVLFGLARERVLLNEAAASQALTKAAAAEVATQLEEVRSAVRSLARTLRRFPDDPVLADALARETLLASPHLVSVAVAYAPGRGPMSPGLYAPQYHRAGDAVERSDLATTEPDYPGLDWFGRGRACPVGCWGEAGIDTQGRWVVDFTAPITGADGVMGVARVQLRLGWLRELLQRLPRREGAFATVIDRHSGLTLAHERIPFVEAIGAEFGRDSGDPALQTVSDLIAKGEPSAVRAWSLTTQQWTHYFFAPVSDTQWMLSLAVSEGEVLTEVRELAWLALALVLAVVAVVGAPLYLFLRRSLAPLGTLTRAAERISKGRLDFELPPGPGRDEVGRLSDAFSRIREDLRAHIEELRVATAERQRLDSELEIAQRLQVSLLPATEFADRSGRAALAATLTPAQSVGGDLYTWFLPDEDHIAFLIGDVADKGIPAALLMARVITLAKSQPLHERNPAGLLRLLNRELCAGNETGLFVTLLAAVVHLETGAIRLASAGHDPPALLQRGTCTVMPVETGPALGLAPEADYPLLEARLEEGAVLLAWTDGITEARGQADDELFGEERLLAVMDQAARAHSGRPAPGQLLEALLARLTAHAGPSPWADDVAALALCYRGMPAAAGDPVLRDGVRRFAPRLKDAMTALDEVVGQFVEVGASGARIAEIRCAIEEILVNCVRHGFSGQAPVQGAGQIGLHWSITHDHAEIVIEDDGIEFNPLEHPGAELSEPGGPPPIGGLGLHLVSHLAKRTRYRRMGTHNRLELGFDL